jgi:hypothetical protein
MNAPHLSVLGEPSMGDTDSSAQFSSSSLTTIRGSLPSTVR